MKVMMMISESVLEIEDLGFEVDDVEKVVEDKDEVRYLDEYYKMLGRRLKKSNIGVVRS